MVLKATAFKEYFNPIVSRDEKGNHRLLVNAVLPNTQKIREIADALSKRAMLKLGEGKIDEAWTDLLVIHRLGRLVARGGTLIELMVGIAIDTVAHHGDLTFLEHTNLSSKQVMRHLKDLQDLPRMSNGTQIIDVAERLTLLDIVQSIRREGFGVLHEVSGNLRRPDKLTSEIEAAFSECDWSTLFRTSNRSFDELGTVMTSPDRATREKEMRKYLVSLRTDKVDANDGGNIADALKSVANTGGIANGKFGGNLVSIWMPAIAKITNTTDRFEQQQNCLLLAFALAAFRDENGKYPQSLEDLTPKYFAMITSDIFSGKPLVYRRKETGYLLYSVGANGRDDGGATFSDDPSADDIRVRVPLPKMKH